MNLLFEKVLYEYWFGLMIKFVNDNNMRAVSNDAEYAIIGNDFGCTIYSGEWTNMCIDSKQKKEIELCFSNLFECADKLSKITSKPNPLEIKDKFWGVAAIPFECTFDDQNRLLIDFEFRIVDWNKTWCGRLSCHIDFAGNGSYNFQSSPIVLHRTKPLK